MLKFDADGKDYRRSVQGSVHLRIGRQEALGESQNRRIRVLGFFDIYLSRRYSLPRTGGDRRGNDSVSGSELLYPGSSGQRPCRRGPHGQDRRAERLLSFRGGRHENASLPLTGVNRYKFGGKETLEPVSLDMLDFGARFYDPRIARWNTQDPLAEKYFSLSPYNYCAGNPVTVTDPDGRALLSLQNRSPIYDRQGKFLGTDDEGLQGEAIVMDSEDFRQGMSPDEARSKRVDVNSMDQESRDRMTEHYNGLKDRPDYDGYLTLQEANEWYRNGNGEPLFASLEKIDLSGIYSLGEKYVGQEKTFNLFNVSASFNDRLVYGTIKLKRYPNHQVRAYSDIYDFDMHNVWNPLNWPRNILTVIGGKIAGQGQSYEINLYGSKTLKPLLPWVK